MRLSVPSTIISETVDLWDWVLIRLGNLLYDSGCRANVAIDPRNLLLLV
jgi:hypothetical protein